MIEYNGSEVWVAAKWGRGLRYPRTAEAAEVQTLRHAHVVVTISNVLRDELVARGIAPERIVAYPNCIDPQVFDPGRYSARETSALRTRLGLPGDACVATFVGTFGAWHGAEVFAEAIALLCRTAPAKLASAGLRFLLVGDGLRMPAVRSILADPACAPFVTYAGLVPQAETPTYLAASDIFVSPHVPNVDGTPFFGSPTKLFEYMAMGKAIIASDLDQIGEVLQHSLRWPPQADALSGALSVLVPPGDPAALAEGLLHLAERPDLRAALGGAARAEALAKYTWNQHVAAILQRVSAVVG